MGDDDLRRQLDALGLSSDDPDHVRMVRVPSQVIHRLIHTSDQVMVMQRILDRLMDGIRRSMHITLMIVVILGLADGTGLIPDLPLIRGFMWGILFSGIGSIWYAGRCIVREVDHGKPRSMQGM